jgi:diguanylate cyclase (GGDEF)-like protein/PAS domain S-box-containing protein
MPEDLSHLEDTPPDSVPKTHENPWKLALEGSGAGVWDWHIPTGAHSHSTLWEEMLGYAAGELPQNHDAFISRVHPDDLKALTTAFENYAKGVTNHCSADIRMRNKSAEWTWIQTRGMFVEHDGDGKPVRMIGTHTDISARKLAETSMSQQTQLLHDIMGSVSQGIFVFDASMRLVSFNDRACELLDLPSDFLARQPSLSEISNMQMERGDFGLNAQWVDAHARAYVCDGGHIHPVPPQFLRRTRSGRTLEVKTEVAPQGGMVRTFSDVTEHVSAQAARDRLDSLLATTQELAQVGGWEVDMQSDQVFWTEGVFRIMETSPQAYTPTTAMATAERFFTPEAMEIVRASYASARLQAGSHDFELEAITDLGRRIWVHSVGESKWQDGRLVSRISVIQNITERKQARAVLLDTENRWKLALESTGDGVWDWHIPSGVEFYSRRLVEMYGYDETEIRNNPRELDDRTHPDDVPQMEADRKAHFDGLTPTYLNEHRIRCKDGSWKWVLSRGMVISRDARGRPLRMLGTHTDITERKNAEALIRQQAFFDTLTGLPNRRMFRDRLEQEVKKCKRDGQQIAILFIDLDHFKEVNDTLGHDIGDQLLVEAARRLKACVRESDTVARMGGDEFTVILTEISHPDHIEPILQKILLSMGQTFRLGTEQVFVSASIGVTIYPLDATEIEDLFKNADQALYVAKGDGRNRFSFFTPALQQAAQMRVRLANDLRTALSDAQFRVVFQPIVELATGHIHKAEALIRWHHPKRGLVSPATFIPVAESSGLIVDIGEWVFLQAAQQVSRWRKSLHAGFQISVNRSPVQFHNDHSGQASWGLQLQAMGLPGDSLVVEITEGLLLDTSAVVGDQLLELSDAGIQVSLDDFGTGYSSLAYLQKFDIDFIKIDQSFVRHLIADSTDFALCKAIIVMAHELGMQVVAEGVETQLQRDLLLAAGCDYGQGYFFSRPVSAEEFEAMHREHQKKLPAGSAVAYASA